MFRGQGEGREAEKEIRRKAPEREEGKTQDVSLLQAKGKEEGATHCAGYCGEVKRTIDPLDLAGDDW